MRQRLAFTLPELVFALVMSAGLMVLWANWPFVKVKSATLTGAARVQVVLLCDAVRMYQLEAGELPIDLEQLLVQSEAKDLTSGVRGPYLEKSTMPVDPWNSRYRYQQLGNGRFRIWSHGPDRISGTPDDISQTF